MAKEQKTPEPPTAPDINPENVNLDVEDAPPAKIEKNQTIEEAQAAADPEQSEEDDAIYREASKDIVADEPNIDQQPSKPKKSKKKLLIALVVIILLAGGAFAAWYFLLRERATQSSAPTEQQAEQTTPELSYIPETVSYAFRDGTSSPFTLFWRPAIGGDRTQVKVLNRSEVPKYSDSYGANVAFVADEKVYVSTDYGKSFKDIFEAEAGAQITNLKLSSDGSKLAMGYLPDASQKGVVKTIDLSGENSKDLFTATNESVSILGWSDKTVVYTESCIECDESSVTPYYRDLSANKVEALLEGVDLAKVGNMEVAGDLSSFIYIEGNSGDTDLLPPYMVKLISIPSLEAKTLTTVGAADEKNPNGTTKTRNIKVGFLAGSVIPYYVEGETLYTVSGAEPNAFYKSDKDIQLVTFASEKYIISGAGGSVSDYSLTSFDIEKSEATAIFQGDANTIILGVTTK